MIYIKFSNATYGEKAVRILKKHSITAVLKRNPNPNHKEGCNYALFTNSDINRALKIINDENIPNLGAESFGEIR
ncbi:MAG: putative Se/S carrier-like protein [Acutalibacteraceae bacterium]